MTDWHANGWKAGENHIPEINVEEEHNGDMLIHDYDDNEEVEVDALENNCEREAEHEDTDLRAACAKDYDEEGGYENELPKRDCNGLVSSVFSMARARWRHSARRRTGTSTPASGVGTDRGERSLAGGASLGHLPRDRDGVRLVVGCGATSADAAVSAPPPPRDRSRSPRAAA